MKDSGLETKSELAPEAGVELPASTSAPLYFALGLSMLLASLVTNVLFAWTGGALAIWGAVAWWREMFPHEQKVVEPAQSEAERAPPVKPVPERVRNLVAGQDGHRVRLPLEYHPYSGGLRGGLAGGAAMVVAALLYGLVTDGSPWPLVNGFAALVFPLFGAPPPPDSLSFHPGIAAAAGLLHVSFSLMLGLVYASVLPMLPGHPRLWGGLVAPLAWSGAGFVCLELVDPGSAGRIQWGVFVTLQIIFGMTAGEVISRSRPVQTLQSYPLAARAGLEAEMREDDT
ncbi:MAG: hypothetical protein P8Q97_05135 [Myxococcota bacterium]|jgi:hypothetical protein|nr:hypothetical protein [Myxococcota bacterium]